MENVEIFEDETVIQLFDEDEKAISFYEIASVELDGKYYELLEPVELLEGMEEGEAVILEYETDEKSKDKTFKPVMDEKLLDAIFDEYLKAASELDGECGCGCGCGCEDDDCECGCGCDCDEDEDEHCSCGHADCDCDK